MSTIPANWKESQRPFIQAHWNRAPDGQSKGTVTLLFSSHDAVYDDEGIEGKMVKWNVRE